MSSRRQMGIFVTDCSVTMKNTYTLTKEKIIQAAFSEWGKNKFCKTSLADLAERLGITKTALYRHFKNKDDLISSMESDLKDRLAAARSIFLVGSENKEIDDIIRFFYATYIPFFLHTPHLFHFLFHLSVMKMKNSGTEPDYFWQESSVLRSGILTSAPYITKELAELFIRFIFTTGVSQIHTTLEKQEKICEKNVRKVIDHCTGIVLNGIHGDTNGNHPDPVSILKGCSLPETVTVAGDKLYSAIAKVVAREGIEGTSTDKIAREIGIAKSSLYFHFKNKQDMLNEMIIGNQQNFMRMFDEKARVYTSSMERIICYMGMVGAWMLQDPSFLSVFTWIWFQRIELELKPSDDAHLENLYSIFRDGIASGEIKSMEINEKQLAGFIIRLVGHEIQIAIREGRQKHFPPSELRHIVNLLFKGVHYYTHRSRT